MEIYPANGLLKPYIRNYLVVESNVDRVNRILPDTSLVAAFRFKGRASYLTSHGSNLLPPAVLSGLRMSARLVHYEKNSGNLLVIFTPAGAAAFFKAPLHELFEKSLSMDHFVGVQQQALLEEQLAEAGSHQQRVTIVDRFLLSMLSQPKQDLLVNTAIQIIRQQKGLIRIKELAARLCISLDAFEKRFRKTTGSTPKQFAGIVRMRSVLGQRQPGKSLTDTAFEAGYYDQAHFSKDFRGFTGLSPTEFLKTPNFW